MQNIKEIDIAQLGHIGILMGGYSSERPISLKSGKAVYAALKACGCRVSSLDIKEKREEKIADQVQRAKIDVAFIALHGALGEDGVIQSILQAINIPYAGSGPQASQNALDKVRSQEIFRQHDIPVPAFSVIYRKKKKQLKEFIETFGGFPAVVKPAREGSSIGISFATDKGTLKKAIARAFKLGSQILVEQYIEGREITVGILTEQPLPVIEIKTQRSFFDFTAKYQKGFTEYIVPAEIPDKTTQEIQRVALAAHCALGCRDFSRVDLMLSEHNQPFVLEVNTIPGFTETSLLPKAAKATNMSFSELCLRLIQLAYEKKEQKI